jgi:large conductance mechanosensitive channel
MVRMINKMKKTEAEAPAAPTADQQLLTEIRDLLKSKNNI